MNSLPSDPPRRPQQLGPQDVVEVKGLPALALHQAVRAVPPVEADQAGGVDQQYRPAQQAGGAQGLHARQPPGHPRARPLPAGEFHVAREVVQGVMGGRRRLRGPGQAVEVGEHPGAAVAQAVVGLAARAQLEQVQRQPPPGEGAGGVGARPGEARVGGAVEPGVDVGEEMAGGLGPGAAGDQGRPA